MIVVDDKFEGKQPRKYDTVSMCKITVASKV